MPLMRSPWKGMTCPCLLMAEQLYHERGGWCDDRFVDPVEPCEAIDVLLRTATYVLVVTFYEGG